MRLLICTGVVIALFAPFLVVLLNKKLRCRVLDKLKHYDPKKVKICTRVLIVVVVVFILTIFYPFESSFIRFDTIEGSVYYSSSFSDLVKISGTEIYTAECDDTVFVVKEHGNTYSYTSIAKYDDGYGYCGHNVSVILSTNTDFVSTSKFEGAVSISAVYNENTNKTCYILNLLDDDFSSDIKEVYDQTGDQMNVFASEDGSILDNYYSIEEGYPCDSFAFILDGETFELDL
ncbi:MAG: hypothetical protein Q4A12_00980 [Eubacteriales bacterium]|nr:hypothetical protein [Eubacteriales bacterium]